MPRKIYGWRVLAVLFLFAVVVSIQILDRGASDVDPDRYFHLALSKIEAQAGTIHTLPQADDTGWAQNFTDKEFLFHWLGRYAYRIAGELGVIALTPILVCGILLVLLLTSIPFGSFWAAWGAEILFFFLCPHFYNRMILLRPHLLAIFFFCGLVGSIANRKPSFAFLSALGFGLAYHSYFVPAFVIFLAFPFAVVLPSWKRTFFGGLIGLALGVVLNPYFPETLQIMFMVMNEASDPHFNSLMETGFELLPLPFAQLLGNYWLHFSVLLAGMTYLFLPALRRRWKEPENARAIYLGLVAVFFAAALVRSPRANEYLTPTLVLFIAAIMPILRTRIQFKRSFVTMAAALFAFYILTALPQFVTVYEELWQRLRGKPVTNELVWDSSPVILEALATLPPDSAGKKVFNCEWWTGSYVLYSRPDMRFVDANAPDYLWLASTDKVIARARLRTQNADQIYSTISDMFASQYVLCENPRIVSVLDTDPRFERLFPKKNGPLPVQRRFAFLYAVRGR